MIELKPMPYSEKYTHVEDDMKRIEFFGPFIKEHLGPQAANEFEQRCESGIRPIAADGTPEQKYETAYSNWMWKASVAIGMIRERSGQEGTEQFVSAEAASLARANSTPSLYLLRMIRAVSPSLAFNMVAKKSAYELQWLTPYSVDELSAEREVLTIPSCKVLDYPNADEVCLVGCQRAYPKWLAEQLKVKMDFDRRGNSCTVTITPLH